MWDGSSLAVGQPYGAASTQSYMGDDHANVRCTGYVNSKSVHRSTDFYSTFYTMDRCSEPCSITTSDFSGTHNLIKASRESEPPVGRAVKSGATQWCGIQSGLMELHAGISYFGELQ